MSKRTWWLIYVTSKIWSCFNRNSLCSRGKPCVSYCLGHGDVVAQQLRGEFALLVGTWEHYFKHMPCSSLSLHDAEFIKHSHFSTKASFTWGGSWFTADGIHCTRRQRCPRQVSLLEMPSSAPLQAGRARAPLKLCLHQQINHMSAWPLLLYRPLLLSFAVPVIIVVTIVSRLKTQSCLRHTVTLMVCSTGLHVYCPSVLSW